MAKSAKGKTTQVKSVRRRTELRRTLPKPEFDLLAILSRPDLLQGIAVALTFLLLSVWLVNFSREQTLIRDGAIATETRLKRVDFTVLDEAATQARREEARRAAPRIYRLNHSYLDRLEAALLGLPRAAAGKSSLDEMSQELILEFQLTDEALVELQKHVLDGEVTPDWKRWTSVLVREQLLRRPLLNSQEFQIYTTTLNRALLLPDGDLQQPLRSEPIELRSEARSEFAARINDLVVASGYPESLVTHVRARLLADPQPTLVHDEEKTEQYRQSAEASIEPVLIEHRRGDVLYRRGDLITTRQLEDVNAERAAFFENAGFGSIWLPRLGVAGLITLLVAFLGAHVIMVYPRITRNALRIAGIGALMSGMLALTAIASGNLPSLMHPAAIAPTLIVAIVVLLAYDQRLALFLSGMQCVLVTLALGQGPAWFIWLVAACGTMILQLGEVRHRNSLIRAGAMTAIVAALGSMLLGLFEVPMVPRTITSVALAQILWSALWTFIASFSVAFLMLGILPGIERLFDITTGMTLADLRDPKQPLLRQLQQKAPGTYNHSLQVANVAEAAADAIGADSLLVYVGALYHDIGKMNKPEYFVENQLGGVNKHDKLSPAMSLLVIVGHVKDGIELAREYGLPRSLQHFIESHHGTTLVEYFYHAARTQARLSDKGTVAEVEFRYPGPKPRTKEAAILMLSDAVESATRAMADPNPSRIENLVRDLSHKRLVDGQFNQCDLTFRELSLIEDAIISRLCAIHHSRISYPSTSKSTDGGETPTTPRTAAAS